MPQPTYSPHRFDQVVKTLEQNGCTVTQEPELPGLFDGIPNSYIKRDGRTAVVNLKHNENVCWEDLRFICEKLALDPKLFNVPDDLLERGPPISLN